MNLSRTIGVDVRKERGDVKVKKFFFRFIHLLTILDGTSKGAILVIFNGRSPYGQ